MLLVGAKGGKGGGGAARAAEEDPNTLRSVATARIIDFVTEGEIVGLADGLKSIKFDGVPIQNDDGSYNFTGVQVEERTGTVSQSAVTGFSQVESETVVDQEVVQASPVERNVTDADIDAVRVKLVIPALTQQDAEDGDLHGYSVSIAVDVQPNEGEWQQVLVDTITGKTTSDYERQYRIERPVGGVPWLFRLRRVSDDHSDDATISDQTYFSSYTEIIDAKLSYPNSAYYAITIDADQFGDKVPTRSYDLYGLIVQIPSNYNPITREYSGIWDGTFSLGWTDNPAWVSYDLIANDRYGLGEYVDIARINKGQLYQISQYCDALVEDGKGSFEPRYTFNAQIRTRDDAFTLLRKVASAFQAICHYGSSTINFTQDAPSDPVAILSPANVIDGQFRYSSTSLKDRATVVCTTYSNPDDGGRPAIDVWEDVDALDTHGWRQKDIVAFGCNRIGQARRVGRFQTESDQVMTRRVNFRCGLDQLFIRPGDVFAIQDPSVAGLRLSGRIKSALGAELFVDALPANISTALQYTLRFIAANGVLQTKDVLSVDKDNNVIEVSGSIGDVVHGAMWALSADQVALQYYRVRSIVRGDDDTFSVDARIYDENKYDRIEKGLVFDSPDFTLLPEGPIPAPTNMSFTETLYRDNASIKTRLTVSVSAPNDPRSAYVQYQYSLAVDSGWISGPVDSSPVLELSDLRDGQEVVVRARAISRLGQNSFWLTQSHEVEGKTAKPTTPTNVQAVIVPESGVRLVKDVSPDVDYRDTAWFVGDSISTADLIHRGAGNEYVWARVASGAYTVFVQDFDTGGRESEFANVELEISPPEMPVVSYRFVGADVVLEWGSVSSDFAIRNYVVGYDDTVLSETLATQFRTAVDFESVRTFTIFAVDIAENAGSATSVEVVVASPDVPELSYVFEGQSLRLDWQDVSTDLPVSHYIVDRGGQYVGQVSNTFMTLPVSFGGVSQFGVTAVDVAGHMSQRAELLVEVEPPSAPNVSQHIEGSNVRLSWSAEPGSLPIVRFEVWMDDTLIETLFTNTLLLPVTWSSERRIAVYAFDSASNRGDAGEATIDVDGPSLPELSIVLEGGTLRLLWDDAKGALPIAHYEVFEAGVLIDRVNSQSYQIVVSGVGERKYGVKAVDTAGSQSNIAEQSITISAPGQPVISYEFTDRNLVLSWTHEPGSLPVEQYLVYCDGVKLAELKANNLVLPVDWGGVKSFSVFVEDVGHNLSLEGISKIEVKEPALSDLYWNVEGANIRVSWTVAAGTLPIDRFQVWLNGDVLDSVSASTFLIPVTWSSQRSVQIIPIDIAGNEGSAEVLLIDISGPSMPELSFSIEGASVRLSWTDAQGALPIKYYDVWVDGAFETRVNGESILIPVSSAGEIFFAVKAVDSADSESNFAELIVEIEPPPATDFGAIFNGRDLVLSWDSLSGTFPISHYEINDGGVKLAEVDATTWSVPVSWAVEKTYGVVAIDIANNRSEESTRTVSLELPTVLSVDHTFEGANAVFNVNASQGSLPIDRLEIYVDGYLFVSVASSVWAVEVNWLSSRVFGFIVVDTAGNTSNGILHTVLPELPAAPEITGSFVGRRMDLQWSMVLGDLPTAYYLIVNDGVEYQVAQSNFSFEIDFQGARDISITGFDTAGNSGPTGIFSVNPVLPNSTHIRADVIDNHVLFYFGATQGSLPIEYFEIRKGADFETADVIESQAGTNGFTPYFERTKGVYTYWVVPFDSAGNEGEPASTTATVSQPPDYVLHANYSDREAGWLGDFNNAVISNRNTLLIPVTPDESWGDYSENGFDTLQEEIDAGYTVFALPGADAGYYERTIDYGVVLDASLITVSATPDLLSGVLDARIVVSFSIDGESWTEGDENQLQIYGINFQFARVRIDVVGDGNDLVEIQDVQIRLDRKLRTDAVRGFADASDENGTRIDFPSEFIDVESLSVEPQGSNPWIGRAAHTGEANVNYADVYLWDLNGNRVSGEFSMTIMGY